MDPFALTGRTGDHVIDVSELGCRLHARAAEALLHMREAAAEEGIDLSVASGWRDFSRQRSIWNAKYRLERPLRNSIGEIIDGSTLSPLAKIEAISRWSAMPGASRHHWGTDCDVYDRDRLEPDAVQLLREEYVPDGPCGRLHAWLQRRMHDFGFYQPYRTDRGGVCPEPWHISYAPVALDCERELTAELLAQLLDETSHYDHLRIEGYAPLRAHLDEWYRRFIGAVDSPPQTLGSSAL